MCVYHTSCGTRGMTHYVWHTYSVRVRWWTRWQSWRTRAVFCTGTRAATTTARHTRCVITYYIRGLEQSIVKAILYKDSSFHRLWPLRLLLLCRPMHTTFNGTQPATILIRYNRNGTNTRLEICIQHVSPQPCLTPCMLPLQHKSEYHSPVPRLYASKRAF